MLKRRSFANPRTKEETRVRSASHLAWVRGHECIIAGLLGHRCIGKIEACHVRMGTDGGLGLKPGDCFTFPACSEAHRLQHSIGEPAFEFGYSVNLRKIADELWSRSPHRAKYERAHPEGKEDMNQWQPMTTAPKDGKLVDLLGKRWRSSYDDFEWFRFTNCYWQNGCWQNFKSLEWAPDAWFRVPETPKPGATLSIPEK